MLRERVYELREVRNDNPEGPETTSITMRSDHCLQWPLQTDSGQAGLLCTASATNRLRAR